jgi:hypothetical protein
MFLFVHPREVERHREELRLDGPAHRCIQSLEGLDELAERGGAGTVVEDECVTGAHPEHWCVHSPEDANGAVFRHDGVHEVEAAGGALQLVAYPAGYEGDDHAGGSCLVHRCPEARIQLVVPRVTRAPALAPQAAAH